eukprot:PhF_6_TR21964/c0_g1_i2/m.31234/K12605/CNOT2, NOT2; CCR4-NOT transcription complex subunit 2
MAQRKPPTTTTQPAAAVSAAPVTRASPNDLYGLMGLQPVIKMENPDLSCLALGYDLNSFGLNLGSAEYIYPTFSSPWSDHPPRVQPEYRIPPCYFMQPPHLRFQMFQRFKLETLFYIFYSMPRDVLQLAAAQELFNREWRYHKEQKLWFTRWPGTEPTIKTTTYEKGSYQVFVPEKWGFDRKDDFVLNYEMLDERTHISSQQGGTAGAAGQTVGGADQGAAKPAGQGQQPPMVGGGVAPTTAPAPQGGR